MAGSPIEKDVWIWLPGRLSPVKAGSLRLDAGQGLGAFQYALEYLGDPGSIALDPVDLPRSRKVFKESRFGGLFGVFRDSGPDSWGQSVLEREHGRALSEIELLELAPGDGVGAIAVGDIRRKMGFRPATVKDLEQAALCFESAQDGFPPAVAPSAIGQALSPDTSLGGAKPKLTVEHVGHLWIAKFPERGDPASLPRREHAMLELGRLCGINTCESQVASLGGGKTVLLVKRFDREPVPGGQARKAYASGHTVMRIAVSKDPLEQKRRSYINFAHELQRWAGSGDKNHIAGQKRELWRRIVFNGLVNNADDHPRNHGLLFDGRSWGLSPVFDVVPSVFEKPSPVLSIPFLPGGQGMVATPENLVEAGRFFGYGKDEAKEALDAMARVVACEWRNALRKAGMPQAETDRMEPAFRLAGRISGSQSQDAGQEPEDFAPR